MSPYSMSYDVDDYTRMDLDFAADGNLRELSGKFHRVNRYTQIDIDYAAGGILKRLSAEEAWETIEDFENEVGRVKIPKFMAWLDVTHPKEVEETIGIPMEVEPLDYMKLEDLSLDTRTHDIFLSSKGFPSVDEPEP
ncbi:hypothetical protein Tco_0958527 [Tanacetum coccineum]